MYETNVMKSRFIQFQSNAHTFKPHDLGPTLNVPIPAAAITRFSIIPVIPYSSLQFLSSHISKPSSEFSFLGHLFLYL